MIIAKTQFVGKDGHQGRGIFSRQRPNFKCDMAHL
jgi:hypothetical protein